MKGILSSIRSIFGGGERTSLKPEDVNQNGLDPEAAKAKHDQFMDSLASLLMKVAMVDGCVTDNERETITSYFSKKLKFDDDRIADIKKRMERTLEEDPAVEGLCKEYVGESSLGERLLLVRLLYSVALADGVIDPKEEAIICYVGALLALSDADFTSIWAEFGKDYSRYYDILGLGRTPTVDEVKAAYQKAKANYDPEKVAHLGPEFTRLAQRRMSLVEHAYKFFQERLGFKD
ncbi:MAG: TerB family tellurite resistance protein [Planctomycetota bacterium]